ncbi:MAG: M3 family metallopeptidase, partial [Pseudobdellovibrionaceae bacterium]
MRKQTYSLLSAMIISVMISGCTGSNNEAKTKIDTKPTGGDTTLATEPIPSQYTPGQVTLLCDQVIAKVETRLTEIAARKNEDRNIDNTLMAFESAMADLNDETSPLTFMGYVSMDEATSAEGSECEEKMGQYYVDIFTRRGLYDALASLSTTDANKGRLLSQLLQSFEQNGLKLDDETLARVKNLKGQLAAKETQFSTNLNTDNSTVTFTAAELEGAQEDFLSRLKKTEDGKFIVTTKSTDYLDLMENVTVSESRRKMMFAYFNRGGIANTLLLQEAVALRAQVGQALGYANWADYRTATRMAKNSRAAIEFLIGLKDKLAIRNQQDFAQLLKFKKELDPTATELNQWDIAFLSNQLQKRDFSLDNEKIREYFPAATVVAGTFQIYSKLLGVKYVEVQNAKVWAEGVKLYEIRHAIDNTLLAYFYADLAPRAGKYGHAAAFPLISGRVLPSGKYSYPVASMVANLSAPANGKPSLLTHDDVDTFFHEFGHIMHQTLTRAPYASLSGTSVAQDFVEAPSQMLENWVWDPSILKIISGHYLRPHEKLPTDLLQKMLDARNFQQGAAYTKQLLYALFDLTIHTDSRPVDVQATYNDLYREIVGQEPIAGNHFPGTFGHMMGGYDAGYYGYLWSEVYAQDMFTQFPSDDLMNSEVGGRYRQTILQQGNMKDAIDLLRDFLGRDPS